MERTLTEQKNSRILGKGKTAKKEKNDKKNKKITKTKKKRNKRLKNLKKEEKKKRRPGRIEFPHVPMPPELKPSPDTSQNQVGSLLCKCVCPLFPFPTAKGEANQTKEENKKEET